LIFAFSLLLKIWMNVIRIHVKITERAHKQ